MKFANRFCNLSRSILSRLAFVIVLLGSGNVVALDVATVSGTTYKNCKILEIEADRIRVMHATGVTSIDFEDLPEQIRIKYRYDPVKAAETRRQRIEKEKKIAAAQEAAAQDAAAQVPKLKEHYQEPDRPPPLPSVSPTRRQVQIALSPLWDSKVQGGSETMQDLQRLFASHARPSAELNVEAELMMADGIRFLCPLRVAEQRLGVSGKISSKSVIACPGFPRSSISYHSYDGQFEGHYNRMYIVVDAADQLLSVELVDETPRQSASAQWDRTWFCYNFVNYRVKSAPRLEISHTIREFRRDMFRVDSALRDPGQRLNGRWQGQPRTVEVSRWYVPRPLVQLILYAVSKATGR